MIPLPLRIAVAVIGFAAFAGSFAIRSSVDRGLRISSDRPPAIQVDALAISARALGAFVLVVGLLMWVANETMTHHSSIF
jgi:hypothetical protein